MSKYLQPEELTLLLIRLRRHQAKLASIRNYTIAQLLQHLPTNSTYQVSCCVAHLWHFVTLQMLHEWHAWVCASLPILWYSTVPRSFAVFLCLLHLLQKMSVFKLQGANASVSQCLLPFYTVYLYYFWKCCIFRNVVKIPYKLILKQNHFLCAAFMVGLAPCATCCITCKLKCISQSVHSYELVTVSVLQVNIGS